MNVMQCSCLTVPHQTVILSLIRKRKIPENPDLASFGKILWDLGIKTMVIITNYRLPNKPSFDENGVPVYELQSKSNPICPACSSLLKFYDRRRRIQKSYGGAKSWIIIRRLRCPNCGTLHNELPDFLTPYKHYKTEVIENVVDDVSTPEDESTEDYPCERTMERWKAWIKGSREQIDGRIKAISTSLEGLKDMLTLKESPLAFLRKDGTGWLRTVNRILYNLGEKIPAVPPSAPSPALF